MKSKCSSYGETRDLHVVYTNTTLAPGDAHTSYTKNPKEVAMYAYMDFLFLMDAKVSC